MYTHMYKTGEIKVNWYENELFGRTYFMYVPRLNKEVHVQLYLHHF